MNKWTLFVHELICVGCCGEWHYSKCFSSDWFISKVKSWLVQVHDGRDDMLAPCRRVTSLARLIHQTNNLHTISFLFSLIRCVCVSSPACGRASTSTARTARDTRRCITPRSTDTGNERTHPICVCMCVVTCGGNVSREQLVPP